MTTRSRRRSSEPSAATQLTETPESEGDDPMERSPSQSKSLAKRGVSVVTKPVGKFVVGPMC